MNRSMYVRGTMVEDGQARELVIADGVVAGAAPVPSREPDAAGWVLPGLADVHNHLLADEAGWPRVVTAGRFLSPPGGYFPGLAREVAWAGLARAAVEEAARSGGWTKIIGDFLGGAGEFVPNWPADVLAEAVAQVHAAGGRVAVHAVGPP